MPGNIDLGDVTLLPGFIDAHTHLTAESSDNYYRDYLTCAPAGMGPPMALMRVPSTMTTALFITSFDVPSNTGPP